MVDRCATTGLAALRGVATTLSPHGQERNRGKTGDGSCQQEQDTGAKCCHQLLPFRGSEGRSAHGALRGCGIGDQPDGSECQ